MFKILAVTDRHLCTVPLIQQIKLICRRMPQPEAIILREKDMPVSMYKELAQEAEMICRAYGVSLILHSFWQLALTLQCTNIHLPVTMLQSAEFQCHKESFGLIGASVHSAEEARQAAASGAHYLTAGHIYATACKAGLPGRGTEFLREICRAVDIPVYAIGGIGLDGSKFAELEQCGAAGACIMSGFMRL